MPGGLVWFRNKTEAAAQTFQPREAMTTSSHPPNKGEMEGFPFKGVHLEEIENKSSS